MYMPLFGKTVKLINHYTTTLGMYKSIHFNPHNNTNSAILKKV